MERELDFEALVKKTQWTIVKQFCLSVIVVYIIPISTISVDIHSESRSIANGLLGVFFNVFSWIYICISLIIIVSFNIKALLKKVKKEMEIVYHGSMWINPGNTSSKLTITEFIETNKHIELMQQRIKNLIQVEKDQKEDILFKVSAMAHDLRTPLTVIKGNSELLQSAPLQGIDVQCLRDIEKASNQLDNYFNQLINYSKTFYSDQISFHQYNISDLSKILEQECAYLIGDNIDYKYETKIELEILVELDLDLIIRSVTNIVNNAVAYADNAKKKIRITLKLEENSIILNIWNNGSKFSNEVLENFGKLFYREDASRNSHLEHFGIGLAFVKQVMNIHSGEVQLENTDNGALVTLIIPIKDHVKNSPVNLLQKKESESYFV